MGRSVADRMAGENYCGHASVPSPRQECELRYILHGVPILARSACQVRRTCRGRQCVIIQLATTFAYKYLPCVETVFPARALVPAGMHEGVTWTVGRVRHSPTYSVGGSEVGKKWIRSCCRRGGCLLPASSKRLLATVGTISLWARRGSHFLFKPSHCGRKVALECLRLSRCRNSAKLRITQSFHP